jgi:hypothetical protein
MLNHEKSGNPALGRQNGCLIAVCSRIRRQLLEDEKMENF